MPKPKQKKATAKAEKSDLVFKYKRRKMKMSNTDTEKVDKANDVQVSLSSEDGQYILLYFRAPKLADVIEKLAMSNYPKQSIDAALQPILAPPTVPEGVLDPIPDLPSDASAETKNGHKAALDKQAELKKLLKTHFITRPGVRKITANFDSSTAIDFASKPPALLTYNPAALREGFTLKIKVDKPVPPDQLRRFGKHIIDGTADLISNARPFKMTWGMKEHT